ncbi:agamous-like mads-box protein agl80-like [Trifolium pratense]|uniref:Agamous-like mads-box protein agl80-like n=1 Tax=Trifolium pratense TaxID=57577 RepID=A0A2K3N1E7_TRIPR|nr:agamous-like mads-box protein agl80-like [Trifolium pratense]
MIRKKVNLAYITNDSKRRGTFNRRKNGLIKKFDEISTLCGIEACAIIFSQNDPLPEVWPSPLGVQEVLSRFRSLSKMEQSKKMLNQESFLKQKIQKGQEQLKKQRNENKRNEMTYLMFQCLDSAQIIYTVGVNDLIALSWMIDHNLKQTERCINETQANEVVENHAENVIGRESGMENNVDAMQSEHWSLDFTNNNFGDVLPFGNGDNVPNGLWPY